ncbi:MAG: formylglycine-generating enzyme family protein, partial [Anaerolineae bacterium]|nr:formylglycine-generating enzyme family protein [Anaerolineae bacterium]
KKETAVADCLRYERACDAINFAGAEPEHNITLTSFWIDRTEVTNRQYRLCVAAGACRPPLQNNSWSHPDYFNNSEFDHFPVIYVSWFDARDYCTWAGRRLPGEAEWEKAARGADGRLYPWGNGTVSGLRANFADKNFPYKYAYDREDDGYKDIAPVGSYPAGASPYGVMDLAGNVHEWVSSLFKPYPYIAGDGREDANQTGERVVRGNALDSDITLLRSAGRSSLPPDKRYDYLGFRCAGDN